MSQGYDGDFIQKFMLVVEQLEVCRELLLANSPGKARMALILLDNLADVLMYRRSIEIVRGATGHWILIGRRYDQRDREGLRQDFRKRIAAIRKDDGPVLHRLPEPMIDEHTAAVLNVAHAYRNVAYHRGSHRVALVGFLASILFDCVGQLFYRSYQDGFGFSSYPPDDRLNALESYGVFEGQDARHRMFYPRKAAERIRQHLVKDLEVSFDEMQASLTSDLRERSQALQKLVSEVENEGMERDEIFRAANSKEFWDRYESDDELVRLANKRDLWERTRSREKADDKAVRSLNDQFAARIRLLAETFTPEISEEYLAKLTASAGRVSMATSASRLLEEYLKIDSNISKAEACLWDVAAEWDQHIQLEIDRMRGK